MPTLICIGLYRLFFYANESRELRHIQVEAAEKEAKFWLEPLELSWNEGFQSRELKQIERHLRDNMSYLIACWNSFFGGAPDDEQQTTLPG